MIPSLVLRAHNRTVHSPFGLLGTDENALSFALGYTFQQCLPFLQWFLKQIGIAGVYRSSLQRARIDLQRSASGQGITDIEIHLPGHFHVIVEAKVGLAVPTIDQCQKYLPRFRTTSEPIQKLVALVQSPDQTFVKEYGQHDKQLSKSLVRFIWPRLVPECIRLMTGTSLRPEEREWIRGFFNFLDQEFSMKAFTTEVWILAISTEALWPNGMSHWEIHQKYRVWWDYREHSVRPLYIAFRVDGVLDSIYQVTRVEHGVPIIDLVPEMKRIRNSWPKQPATIWHLGPPVLLAEPLKTGGGMYNRRVRCDLDLLLTCSSVQEIEVEMRKRRRQPEELV
ncbi:MAG: hypothetical protein U1E05_26225 [Patescibacteria group bacterium]|nr:hypothetical protein [Patescibacteria group bacterium]